MHMSLLHLYARVLALLGPEKKLGIYLAVANFALAGAMFAEPVLFGRIIDALAGAQAKGTTAAWPDLIKLIAAWVAFGLFTIVVGVTVALYADRLAHRRRQAVLTDFFDHVLQLPLTFHGESHSGRLMKVMLAGTDALWMLWLDFFRDLFAAGASLVVLLPFALYLNWTLGLMMVAVAVVFATLTTLVVNKTETLQRTVERHYSDLAERASDTLGNVALVQGFARVEAEVTGLRTIADDLLAAQIPVLSWWAVVAVLTRASTTLTMLAIFVVGVMLHFDGRATIGDIVMFMNFAGLLIGQLEKFVRFINKVFMDAPRLREFFTVLDTESNVRDAPDAVDPGRMRGLVEFNNVSFSYDGKRPAVLDISFTALPGETIALVGSTGAGKSTALALLHRAFDPQTGMILIDGMNIRRRQARRAPPQHRRRLPGVAAAQPFGRRQSADRQARRHRAGHARRRRARPGARLHRARARHVLNAGRRTRPLAVGRRAPAPLDRARHPQGPAHPHPRRSHQCARRRNRAKGAGGARRGDEEPHHLRDRASALDRAQRHPHPGVRARPHRRDRHVRRTGPHRRTLRGARQGAVHDDRDPGASPPCRSRSRRSAPCRVMIVRLFRISSP